MATMISNLVLADDDQDDVEFFQEAVEITCPRIKLSVANNGTQLLDILKLKKPDAIVLDLNMPEKSGKECLIEIKANERLSDIPVIIFSTSNSARDIDFCLKNGASYYYVKPKTFRGMMHVASDLCSGRLRNKLHNKY